MWRKDMGDGRPARSGRTVDATLPTPQPRFASSMYFCEEHWTHTPPKILLDYARLNRAHLGSDLRVHRLGCAMQTHFTFD
jgi:hypothetical protein